MDPSIGTVSPPAVPITENSHRHTEGSRARKIALFGHFGRGNFGNESTFQAMLCHLRRRLPYAEFDCICTGPDTVSTTYDIRAVSSRDTIGKLLMFDNPLARLGWKLIVGIPCEVYRSARLSIGCGAHKCWSCQALGYSRTLIHY